MSRKNVPYGLIWLYIRGRLKMPFSPDLRLERGDLVTLFGSEQDVARAAKNLGYPDRPSVMTDMIFVGLGIFLGGLVGLITIVVAGLPLTLTASGGALIMGLVFGWLRGAPNLWSHPGVRHVDLRYRRSVRLYGLRGTGRRAQLLFGMQKSGLSLVFVGLIVAILPHTAEHPFRTLCPKNEPRDRPGCLFRRRYRHRRASCDPGGSTK